MNKIKSLIYLSCFILTAVIYEQAGVELSSDLLNNNSEIAEAHISDELYSNEIEVTLAK